MATELLSWLFQYNNLHRREKKLFSNEDPSRVSPKHTKHSNQAEAAGRCAMECASGLYNKDNP